MKELGFFIAISAVFHFLVSTSTLYFAEKIDLTDRLNRPTEIEMIESKTPDEFQRQIDRAKQLVKQLQTTVQKMQTDDKIARFDSEQTQRVSEETRAAKLGLSQNSMPKILPDQQPENKTPKTDGDLPEFAKFRSNPIKIPVSQESAISNSLPSDIKLSNSTNLNTDANIYYSFYSRVEELFYVRWIERNNYHWSRISFDYKRNVLAGKTWTTELEIWLKANGEYHSSYIKRSSGYQPFDEAAVFAFKNTGLFPNPPKAKVELDGFVRLRYRFNVNVATY